MFLRPLKEISERGTVAMLAFLDCGAKTVLRYFRSKSGSLAKVRHHAPRLVLGTRLRVAPASFSK
jgi:hypothetical protein